MVIIANHRTDRDKRCVDASFIQTWQHLAEQCDTQHMDAGETHLEPNELHQTGIDATTQTLVRGNRDHTYRLWGILDTIRVLLAFLEGTKEIL